MLARPRPLLVEATGLELECVDPTIWRAANYVTSKHFFFAIQIMEAAACRSFFKLVSSAVDNAVGGRNNGLSLSYIHMFI